MTVNLTWTPGSGATSQTVEYRVKGTSSWTQYTVFNNNTISNTSVSLPDGNYDFRILNSCNLPSNIATVITVCPPPVYNFFTLSTPSIA